MEFQQIYQLVPKVPTILPNGQVYSLQMQNYQRWDQDWLMTQHQGVHNGMLVTPIIDLHHIVQTIQLTGSTQDESCSRQDDEVLIRARKHFLSKKRPRTENMLRKRNIKVYNKLHCCKEIGCQINFSNRTVGRREMGSQMP